MSLASERSDAPRADQEAVRPFAEAIAADADLLASMHDRELTREVVQAARECPVAEQLALALTSPAGKAAAAAFDAALATVPDDIDADVIDELGAQFADVYLRHTYRASPCESVWTSEDGLERQEAMFKAEQWYRRHNLRLDDWAQRPADHLVIELRFLSFLADEAKDVDGLIEVARFLDEHPLRWLDRLATTLDKYQAPPIYVALARLTAAWAEEARTHLTSMTGLERPAVVVPDTAKAKGKPEKTCADPDDRPFVPGIGPGW